jgi:molybdopterin-guanine dinucleotide biosynthesis protein A
MNFTAVILAGGNSSRMGRDKAFLEIGGQTLLARQLGLARAVGAAEVFISGRADTDYTRFGCRVLLDNFSNAGPLAGIASALAIATTPLLLVLAVDLPRMTADFLCGLAAHATVTTGAIPRLGGRVEPLAAFYPTALKPEFSRAGSETGVPGAKDFAAQCVAAGRAKFVDFPAAAENLFANWNSPADLTDNLLLHMQQKVVMPETRHA